MDGLPSRMGYDRGITTFSPDGRILQVEYARKTVNQGTPAVGIVYKDGVVLLAVKKIIDKLMVSKTIEKVSNIDSHIGVTMAGLIGDGRILIENAQKIAQQHKMTFDEPINTLKLVKDISNIKQSYTLYGGSRPFGISLLIAGVDEEPRLFVTEPSGIYFEYLATAIGEKSSEIQKELEKNYKPGMKKEQAVKLGVDVVKKAYSSDLTAENFEISVVNMETRNFERIDSDAFLK